MGPVRKAYGKTQMAGVCFLARERP
jgi:hypothetical protein